MRFPPTAQERKQITKRADISTRVQAKNKLHEHASLPARERSTDSANTFDSFPPPTMQRRDKQYDYTLNEEERCSRSKTPNAKAKRQTALIHSVAPIAQKRDKQHKYTHRPTSARERSEPRLDGNEMPLVFVSVLLRAH